MDTCKSASMIAAVAAWVVLAAAGSLVAEEKQHSVSEVSRAGGRSLAMAKFYTGPLETVGTFPGKLLCLRCNLAHGSAAECAKEGHRHVLSMEDGSMIHPLLAGTEEIFKQLNSNELHNKKVKVDGKYYSSTGAILVNRIALAE